MADQSPPIVEVQHLTFEYPGVCALDNVSLQVRRGDIAALVGPNGAGKTTLLRCLAALDTPVSGTITIDGLDVLSEPRACHRIMGYVSDAIGIYPQLTVRQSLHYVARANGLRMESVEGAVRTAAKRLQIDDRLEQRASTLSRGLSQRLAIAQAIVHEPKLLLLDEPASGLDPEARRHLSQLFLDLRGQGMTLIVSSHILAELEEYATSMIVVRHGKILDHQLLGRQAAETVAMTIALSAPVEQLQAVLEAQPGVADVRVDGAVASFRFLADKGAQQQLLHTLVHRYLPVCAFGEERHNLQDTYLLSIAQTKKGASL